MTWVFEKTLQEALKQYLEGQRDEAAAAIQRQMARGRVWRITEDKAAAMAFAYSRAAQEGVARRNLDLIAEAFFRGAEEPAFAPDEFRRHVLSLSYLTVEEIYLLSALQRLRIEAINLGENAPTPGKMAEVIVERLVGTPMFPTEVHVEMRLASLVRTGWVIPQATYGGAGIMLTPLFDDMMRLINWEEAAADEDRRTAC